MRGVKKESRKIKALGSWRLFTVDTTIACSISSVGDGEEPTKKVSLFALGDLILIASYGSENIGCKPSSLARSPLSYLLVSISKSLLSIGRKFGNSDLRPLIISL